MLKGKITALVLAAAVGVSVLSVSAATADERDELGRWDVEPPRTEANVPAFKPLEQPEEDAATTGQEETGEEPAKVEEAKPVFELEPVDDPEGVLSFVNLERRMREGSLDMLVMQENIDSILASDYEQIGQDLRDMMALITDMQWGALTGGSQIQIPIFGDNPTMEDQMENAAINGALQGIASISGSMASQSMQTQYDAVKDQYEDLMSGQMQQDAADGVRQLEDTQKNVVMLAQSAYVQLVEGLAGAAAMDRAVEALERQIQELELRYEMGQISALTLQEAKAGLSTLKSNRASLAVTLESGLMNIKSLVGEELTAPLQLTELPEVDEEIVAAMELESDLAAAMEKSFTLYNAKNTLDDAEETYKDAKKEYATVNGVKKDYKYVQAEHAWQAAQYTYESAVRGFELSFRTLYAQVKDYQQVLTAARTTLAVEEANYAAAQLKYEQGTISQNALLTAENELHTAQDTVNTAMRNLFMSYNNYRWAVDHGILN